MNPQYFLLLVITTGLLIGCKSPVMKVYPKFKKGIQESFMELAREGQFKNVEINASSKSDNSDKPLTNLDIKLYDGDIKDFTKPMLDSLAKLIASKAKIQISNSNIYDWINIFYLTTDHTPVSDSTDQSIFVFRTEELN